VVAPLPTTSPVRWQRVTVQGLSSGTYSLSATCDGLIECPWQGSSFVINLVVTSANQAPDVVLDVPASVTLSEGDSLTIDGSGSTDDGTIISYEWYVDGAGLPAATGPTFTYETTDGPATHIVTLVVTDDEGAVASAGTEIGVENLPPAVAANPADQTILQGADAVFSGSFNDPGANDSPFLIEWDFDDGSTAGDGLNPVHAYAGAGVYSVTLTVTDKDGGEGSAGVMVTVLSPAEAADILGETIAEMGLSNGTAKSLSAPLGEVIDLLEDGNDSNDAAACGKLDAFVNHVNTMENSGKLTPEQADQLRADAEAILESLGC